MDLEVNLLQRLVDQLLNLRSIGFRQRRLVLRLYLACSRFPLIWIDKVALFTCSLSYKGRVGDEILYWYDIHVTHMMFIDKILNLLVLLNFPDTESWIRCILEDASDAPYMLRLEGPGTLMVLTIYQDCSAAICNVLPWIFLEFETICVGKSLLQSIILIWKCSHGDDKYLRYSCCQWHQCQYLLKKRV